MTNATRSRTASTPLAVAAATLALSDAAHATTINEVGDFGNTFGAKTLLPMGTDVVNGAVFAFEADAADFITFQGLAPGASFTATTTKSGGSGGEVLTVAQLDAIGGTLQSDASSPAVLSGTVPGTGLLNFGLTVPEGGTFYQLTLVVPEPSTALLLGGGLLAVAALRRTRRGSAAVLGSGTPDPMRADLAVTVFLSDASEYEGGELALQTSFGEHEVKLPAGSAVVYPATTLHQVRPVTRGVRLVAVTWVQSWVRDPAAREILADISRAAEAVQRNATGSEESLLLSRAYANLLRRESG